MNFFCRHGLHHWLYNWISDLDDIEVRNYFFETRHCMKCDLVQTRYSIGLNYRKHEKKPSPWFRTPYETFEWLDGGWKGQGKLEKTLP